MKGVIALVLAYAWACAGPASAAPALKDCAECPDLVAVAPGSFTRGATVGDVAADPGELPPHEVTVRRPFAIAATPVTVDQFAAFVAATGYALKGGCHTLTDEGWRVDPAANFRAPGFAQNGTHPAVCVSWNDAQAYVAWLSQLGGRRYRLPSEAEWELAARGGTATRNFWGDDDRDACLYANVNDIAAKNKTAKVAVNCDDGYLYTSPVARFRPNPFGLYDMIGNAWAWTADCWLGDYARSPRDGSAAEVAGCAERVLRGSSWTDTPGPVRINAREHRPPSARLSIVGFRVARDLE
jgi:formylglycine-generating enzyme required for sulfatase activity